MPRLQFKTFGSTGQLRKIPNGRAEIVTVDDTTVGRSRFEPGWRWSKDLAQLMGTQTCKLHHLGYSISGLLRVVMDDGQSIDIPPGSVYEIPSGHDAWVVGAEPWETIEWTSARDVGVPPDEGSEHVLLTIVFTDIVNSTATLQRTGDAAWGDLLRLHNARFREELNRFRGREVNTTGDGFLAVFDSATRAVRCAAAMSRAAQGMGLSIRAGVHTGEVEFAGGDARGLAVHAAARVMSLAGPNEVLVSATTSHLLAGTGVTLEDAGAHELKGLPGRQHVFRMVTTPGSNA